MARTPLELVRLAAEFLGQRGVPSPRLDAEVLLARILGVPRIRLYVDFDKPLAEAEVDAYREALRRRARREPTAHITGVREFWSLEFGVDRRVLVPRPDTEVLVEACLERMGDAGRLADLGVGSGAIALALLSERPGWTGVGVDASPEALAVAAVNAASLGLAPRLDLRHGEWCGPLAGERFDLLVSNPPYIPTAELATLEPEVARFDPRLALDGGPDGLACLRAVIAVAPTHLAPGGWLALEFGAGQQDAVAALIEATGSFETPHLRSDYGGHVRAACARRRVGSSEWRVASGE